MSEDRPRLQAVAGLAKVPPPTPRPQTTIPPAPARTQAVAGPKPSTPPATPSRSAAPRPASKASDGAQREITFTLPVSVRDQLRAAATDGTTIASVVLRAVERQHGDLATLVAAEQGEAQQGSSLFPDPAQARTRPSEPRVVQTLRLSAANLEVLDSIAAETKAESRSQMLTAALRADLRPADATQS